MFWVKKTHQLHSFSGKSGKTSNISFMAFFSVRWAWKTASASTRTQMCRAAVSRRRPSIVCRWSFAAAETTTSRTGLRFSGSITDTWTSPPKKSRSEWITRWSRLWGEGMTNYEREWPGLIMAIQKKDDQESEDWMKCLISRLYFWKVRQYVRGQIEGGQGKQWCEGSGRVG